MLKNLIPARGAVSTLSLEVERELTPDDLLELQNALPSGAPPIKTISARHRRQAQLIAEGKSPQVVADALGTTPQRIYQLKADPAFKELVAYYQDQIHEKSLDDEQRFQGKLRAAGEMALDEINERLEGSPASVPVSTSELRQIVAMSADRTVAPPKVAQGQVSIPQNITLNFGTTLKQPKIIDQNGKEE